MSVSSLLADNPDKAWSNLKINSLKVYNDLEVLGNSTLANEQISYTFTATGYGQNVDITFKEVGGLCTMLLNIPPEVVAGASIIELSPPAGFPSRFEPEIQTYFYVSVRNGNYANGSINIDTDGEIQIGLAPAGTAATPGNFTDGALRGLAAVQLSYMTSN